jgi:ankyrin repeat protein
MNDRQKTLTPNLNSDLFKAILECKQEEIKRLIHEGADLAATNQEGYTPLEYAVYLWGSTSSWRENVKAIISCAKHDLNKNYKYGRVLLNLVRSQEYELAKLLLDLNPELNWFSEHDNNNYPIHYTVINNAVEMFMLLIKKGAALDVKNKEGYTAFTLACSLGQWHFAEILLRDGTCLLRNAGAEKASIAAAKAGKFDLLNRMIKANALAKKTITGQVNEDSFLHYIVNPENPVQGNDTAYSLLSLALQHGANPAVLNQALETPIELAAKLGNWRAVKIFIEMNDFKKTSQENIQQIIIDLHYKKVLLHAREKNNDSIVKLLEDQIPQQDKIKTSALEAVKVQTQGETQAQSKIKENLKQKSIEELREEVERLYGKLCTNQSKPSKVPALITRLAKLWVHIFKKDQISLNKKINELTDKNREKLKSQSLTQTVYISQIVNNDPDSELNKLNAVFKVINTLCHHGYSKQEYTYSEFNVDPEIIETNDICFYFKLKIICDNYIERLRAFLTHIKREIERREWQSHLGWGIYTNKQPLSIQSIAEVLKDLCYEVDANTILAIYKKVCDVYNSRLNSKDEDQNTKNFFSHMLQKIIMLDFIPRDEINHHEIYYQKINSSLTLTRSQRLDQDFLLTTNHNALATCSYYEDYKPAALVAYQPSSLLFFTQHNNNSEHNNNTKAISQTASQLEDQAVKHTTNKTDYQGPGGDQVLTDLEPIYIPVKRNLNGR